MEGRDVSVRVGGERVGVGGGFTDFLDFKGFLGDALFKHA